MNKKDLSERDICSKFIGPAVKRAGWDGMMQIREEVNFTKGRIIVRGKLVTRGKAKRADYILYYKPNIPIAIIEAKDNNHSVGDHSAWRHSHWQDCSHRRRLKLKGNRTQRVATQIVRFHSALGIMRESAMSHRAPRVRYAL
jgi:hypothetical protein